MLARATGRQDETGAEPAPVRARAIENHRQVVRARVGLRVFVDRRRRVDVVHDEIELAVVVEIDIGRAVGEARLVNAPRVTHIGEGQVAVVTEHAVRELVTAELPQLLQSCVLVAGAAGGGHCHLVVEVVGGLGIAVRHKEVFAPIVVEIGE